MVKQVTLHDDWPFNDPWGVGLLESGDLVQDGDIHVSTPYFANAVQVWATLHDDEGATIGSAALAFNVTPDVILQAVIFHPYMFATGDFLGPLNELHIEHDGE